MPKIGQSKKLTEWGLANAKTESWGVFGYGWEVERFSAEMTALQYMNLIAYPQAWTPGTDGVITGNPVLIDPDDESVEEEFKGKLAGAIVLFGHLQEMDDHSEPTKNAIPMKNWQNWHGGNARCSGRPIWNVSSAGANFAQKRKN
ncbi:MAG: hypothetical protein R3C26_11095 [Calditrichia bacterium]